MEYSEKKIAAVDLSCSDIYAHDTTADTYLQYYCALCMRTCFIFPLMWNQQKDRTREREIISKPSMLNVIGI